MSVTEWAGWISTHMFKMRSDLTTSLVHAYCLFAIYAAEIWTTCSLRASGVSKVLSDLY